MTLDLQCPATVMVLIKEITVSMINLKFSQDELNSGISSVDDENYNENVRE